MTQPAIAVESYGAKFLLDNPISDRVVITFDNFNQIAVTQNGARTLEVEGVDYQVPNGKELLLTGIADLSSPNSNNEMDVITATVANSLTGQADLIPNISSGVPTTYLTLLKIVTQNLFVSIKGSTLASRQVNVKGFQGVEYTP